MSRPGAGPGPLRRRALWLAGASMAWTVALAAAAVTAGVLASSIALVGLGLESVIELLASAIVVWHLAGRADRETRATRLIGVTFLASAVFLLAESTRELVSQAHSEHSTAGLITAAAAVAVMPVLAAAKHSTGRALASRPLLADAAETAQAAVAAAAALLGVGLDTWLGWWWAVPVAGLVIAVIAVIEGAWVLAGRH